MSGQDESVASPGNHEYCDLSNIREEDGTSLQSLCPEWRRRRGYNAWSEQGFPVKLHDMLTAQENTVQPAVSWQPHGRSFVVTNQREFCENVLPQWFRHNKFESLLRQLNLYGFRRISAGRDRGGYYHEMFLRGRRFLAQRILRQRIKGTRQRQPNHPQAEPNFYLLPFVCALDLPLPQQQESNPPSNVASTAAPAQEHHRVQLSAATSTRVSLPHEPPLQHEAMIIHPPTLNQPLESNQNPPMQLNAGLAELINPSMIIPLIASLLIRPHVQIPIQLSAPIGLSLHSSSTAESASINPNQIQILMQSLIGQIRQQNLPRQGQPMLPQQPLHLVANQATVIAPVSLPALLSDPAVLRQILQLLGMNTDGR